LNRASCDNRLCLRCDYCKNRPATIRDQLRHRFDCLDLSNPVIDQVAIERSEKIGVWAFVVQSTFADFESGGSSCGTTAGEAGSVAIH